MFELIKKIFIGLLLTGVVNRFNHTKCFSLSNQKCEIQPTLINLHPKEEVKNFTTIHFRLNKIDVLEVAILLMTYIIKHVFQI